MIEDFEQQVLTVDAGPIRIQNPEFQLTREMLNEACEVSRPNRIINQPITAHYLDQMAGNHPITDPRCDLCKEIQNSEHVLLYCPDLDCLRTNIGYENIKEKYTERKSST